MAWARRFGMALHAHAGDGVYVNVFRLNPNIKPREAL